MHEGAKLVEACHFLGQMRRAEADWNETLFSHEVSAFLSAGRSVLQYLYAEAQARGELAWYQAAVAADPSIPFLKEERDVNIHKRPVALANSVSQALGVDARGEECVTVEREFFFWGWPGPEGAVALAERYLRAIECIVNDGRARGVTAG